jgi:hypothetical protein
MQTSKSTPLRSILFFFSVFLAAKVLPNQQDQSGVPAHMQQARSALDLRASLHALDRGVLPLSPLADVVDASPGTRARRLGGGHSPGHLAASLSPGGLPCTSPIPSPSPTAHRSLHSPPFGAGTASPTAGGGIAMPTSQASVPGGAVAGRGTAATGPGSSRVGVVSARSPPQSYNEPPFAVGLGHLGTPQTRRPQYLPSSPGTPSRAVLARYPSAGSASGGGPSGSAGTVSGAAHRAPLQRSSSSGGPGPKTAMQHHMPSMPPFPTDHGDGDSPGSLAVSIHPGQSTHTGYSSNHGGEASATPAAASFPWLQGSGRGARIRFAGPGGSRARGTQAGSAGTSARTTTPPVTAGGPVPMSPLLSMQRVVRGRAESGSAPDVPGARCGSAGCPPPSSTQHPAPCTLHPTPYTPHPKNTLHPTPYSLSTPYTLHPPSMPFSACF